MKHWTCEENDELFSRAGTQTNEGSPRKTSTVPSHCKEVMTFPNRRTEPRMVKNFLVVVTMEQVRGPKLTTVMKMKV